MGWDLCGQSGHHLLCGKPCFSGKGQLGADPPLSDLEPGISAPLLSASAGPSPSPTSHPPLSPLGLALLGSGTEIGDLVLFIRDTTSSSSHTLESCKPFCLTHYRPTLEKKQHRNLIMASFPPFCFSQSKLPTSGGGRVQVKTHKIPACKVSEGAPSGRPWMQPSPTPPPAPAAEVSNSDQVNEHQHLFLFSFLLFRATPAAYGGSQARGQIRATTATATPDPSRV